MLLDYLESISISGSVYPKKEEMKERQREKAKGNKVLAGLCG
jgi:hypothetical protein